MLLLGYTFTTLNYACYCLSRFMKTKKMMLFLDLISKIFTSLGLYCLNSLSGAYVFIAVFFMLIIANIKERQNKRWLIGYIFFQSLYLIILYIHWHILNISNHSSINNTILHLVVTTPKNAHNWWF